MMKEEEERAPQPMACCGGSAIERLQPKGLSLGLTYLDFVQGFIFYFQTRTGKDSFPITTRDVIDGSG